MSEEETVQHGDMGPNRNGDRPRRRRVAFEDDRTLLRLALPAIGSGLITVSYNWIDTYFVGHIDNAYLREAAVAALTISWFTVWIFSSLGSLIDVGLTALVGRYVGAGKIAGAAYAAGQGLRTCIGLCVPAAILGWIAAPLVFSATSTAAVADPVMVFEGTAYIRIYWIGGFVVLIDRACSAIYRGHGNTWTPFVVSLGGLALNWILNPIFIYGRGDFEGLGAPGAALATIIAQMTSAVVGVWLLTRLNWIDAKKPPEDKLRLTATTTLSYPRVCGLDLNIVVRVCRVGVPMSVAGILFSVLYLWLSRIVAEAGGTAALAGLGIGLRGESVAFLCCSGYSVAAASLVGRQLGAGRADRAASLAWRAVLHAAVASGIWAVVLLFFHREVAALFIPGGNALDHASSFLSIIAFCLVPLAVDIVLQGAFSGAGMTIPPMVTSIVLTLVRIPLSIFAVTTLDLGTEGIWWVISLTAIARGGVQAWWFLRGTWKTRSV